MSLNLILDEPSEHIHLRYHMISDSKAKRLFMLEHITTDMNMADAVTKSLENLKNRQFTEMFLQDLG